MYEVLFEKRPYCDDNNMDFNLFNLGSSIINAHRPTIPQITFNESEKKYIELMMKCWTQDQSLRPSCKEIYIEMNNNILSLLD